MLGIEGQQTALLEPAQWSGRGAVFGVPARQPILKRLPVDEWRSEA